MASPYRLNLLNSPQKQLRHRPTVPLWLVLILPFVLLTTGATGVVGYLAWRNGQQSVNNLANQLMDKTSERITEKLNTFLSTPHLINASNLNAVELNQIDPQDFDQLGQHFFRQLQLYPDITAVVYANEQGEIIGYRHNGQKKEMTIATTANPGTRYHYWLDEQGNQTQLSRILQNYDPRKRPWYKVAKQTKRAGWSPIYPWSIAPDVAITAVLPTYRADGTLEGVFAVDILLRDINRYLRSLLSTPTGQIFIIESSGELVATSTTEAPFIVPATGLASQQVQVLDSQDQITRTVSRQIFQQFGSFDQITKPQQLRLTIPSAGTTFVQVIPHQDAYGLKWLVVTVLPESDFMAQINANTRTTILLCIGALLGSIALGLLLARWIVRPMQRLGQASFKLADGTWDQITQPESSITELHVLNTCFQQMAKQLQQSFDRVKNALEESEEKFTKIFRTCPDAIGIVTLQGHYVEVNDAFVNLFGYSRAEVIGHAATEVGHWVNLQDRENYLQLIQTGVPVRNLEFTLQNKTGDQLTVLFSADSIEIQEQYYIIGIAKDISDRKQTELELEHQKDLRETIFNESTDALFLVNPTTLLIFDCNRQAVEMFEADQKTDLLGIEGRTLQRHSFSSEEIDQIVSELKQGGFWSQEVEYVTQKGNFFWGNLAVKLVHIAGQAVHLVRVTDITDRKRAEEALRQNEARLQRLAAAVPGAIYTLVKRPDDSFYFEYISPAIEAINELTAETLLAEPSIDLIHPQDRPGYDAAVAHSAETLEAFSSEFRIITPSGKLKWLQANSRPVLRENGEIAWYGILLDVSDRKQAEEALYQSQVRLQNVATAAPVNIYSLVQHPDGSIEFEYINRVVEEFHEISLEEFLVEPHRIIMEQMHPEDRAGYLENAAQSAETLGRFQYEWRIITPSGRLKWLQAHSQPERRENGDICWHGVTLDISDRKHAEEALRQSEQLFRGAFETSAFGISIRSPEGKYLRVNQALCEMLGYTESELLKMSYQQITHPDDLAIDPDNTIGKLLGGEVPYYYLEKRFLHKAGYTVWGLVSISLVRDLQQQPLYFVAQIQDITDRKLAEAALRHSEAALRRAQQVAHVGSWEIDIKTEQVTWSEESFHIFGWDTAQPEPTLSQFYQLVHPDDQATLRQSIEHIIANGGSYKTEFQIIQPNGSFRYVEARGEAIVNEQGELLQLLGTNLDITERRMAEEALRYSEATKNQILKAIPDLMVWMTADGTCIDQIDGGSVTNLYVKSEAVGQNLFDLLPLDLAQARMNAIQNALKSGEIQIYEHQILIRGEMHHEEVRVIGVGEDRVLIIVRDITNRKRAEAALQDSEARFRSAFEDAPIGMALIGMDNRWLKTNPMLCDMLGYSEAELRKMNASAVIHPEDVNKFRYCVEQVQSNETRNAQAELRYCCHEGSLVWGMLSLSLVRDARYQPLYYVAQIQDITERQAIDRMKNEFISIVSHELRTPLTAIRGFLGLLNTGIYDKKPDKAKHMIGQALINSDRLVRLVNDILDLERLSSGKVELVMQVCDAEDLMQRSVAGVQSIADQAAITLTILPTSAQVWAAADLIIQTFTNLLSNAIKFSPPNSVVTLSAQVHSNSVVLSVADQGRGIPVDKLETIFGRFQQVDVSDARQKGGTGLGLAICQSIVQQHGGNIWAESQAGKGSIFYFTLPLPPKGES